MHKVSFVASVFEEVTAYKIFHKSHGKLYFNTVKDDVVVPEKVYKVKGGLHWQISQIEIFSTNGFLVFANSASATRAVDQFNKTIKEYTVCEIKIPKGAEVSELEDNKAHVLTDSFILVG